MDKSRDDVVISAVEAMKKGQFGLTGIKVELEAQFNRNQLGGDTCDYCDEGYQTCEYCDIESEVECGNCEGSGNVWDYETESDENCVDCDGIGALGCTDCDGQHSWTCEECGGDWESSGDGDESFRLDSACHDFIMERLTKLGLAEETESIQLLSHGVYSRWKLKAPLVYAEFYRDGSVDSEFTFTLSVKDPKSVILIPKVIEIWNELGEAIGQGVDVRGAGMHMALLQSKTCVYPQRSAMTGHTKRFQNFRRSMGLLLPALYFLGSSDETSRGLRFREPMVNGQGRKYSAVYYNGGALEFRVFNTCYDKPETVFDNIVVMKNCLKYWTNKFKPSGLAKIAKEIRFGVDNNDRLDRFYSTTTHIDLLNAGLMKLKPSYLTIKQVKTQRRFDKTKRTVKKEVEKRKTEAQLEYKEYENRFSFNLIHERHWRIARSMETMPVPPPEEHDKVLQEITERVETEIKNEAKKLKSLEQYIEEKVSEFQRKQSGQYLLAE